MIRLLKEKQRTVVLCIVLSVLTLAGLLFLNINPVYSQGLPTRNESIESFRSVFLTGEINTSISIVPLIVYVGIALAVMVGVVAIAFALGYAFNMQRLILWGKVEMVNSIATAVLIWAIAMLLFGGTDFISVFLGEGRIHCQGREFNASDTTGILLCRIEEKIIELDNLYDQIYRTNKNWEYEGSKCYSFFGFTIQCGDWKPRISRRIEMAHLLTTKITGLQIGLNMEYVAVQYIVNNMLSIFLPIGLVFRAFPITRGVGGLMIAMALGLFFIFPMFAVFLDPGYIEVPETTNVFEYDYTEGCYGGFLGAISITNYIRDDYHVEMTNFQYEHAADIYTNILYGVQFYHFIAFAITVVIIGIIAPIFGGDVGEITRFIMKVV